MLDAKKLIQEAIYLDPPDLHKPLPLRETYLGSDLFSRVTEDRVMVYYLDSSDQIQIPREYINLFQYLQTRDGGRLRKSGEEFIALGLNLPGIFLHRTDSRGIRNILSRMVVLGTSRIREIIPDLGVWILSNVNDTIEI